MARIREYEEIIDLQEKAIEALKQATTVLQQALHVLERARAEHGYQHQMPWNQQYQYQVPAQPYYVYSGNSLIGGIGVANNGNLAKENFDYVPETIFKY